MNYIEGTPSPSCGLSWAGFAAGTRATEGRRAVKTFRLGNQNLEGYDCSGARHAAGNKTETQKERRKRQEERGDRGFLARVFLRWHAEAESDAGKMNRVVFERGQKNLLSGRATL